MRRVLFLILLLSNTFYGYSQEIITTAENVTSGAGMVIVPIQVTNCNNVSAISLVLDYDESSLTYIGYQNLNTNLASGFIFINENNGRVITSWISTNSVNIGDAVLYDLIFNTDGSAGYLIWDTFTSGNCEYADNSGNILPAVFINGGVNYSATQVQLNLKVYLEGPFNGFEMTSKLNDNGLIPLIHPYNSPPWNYSGSENLTSVPNTNIVDWVLVEFRETSGDASTATADKRIARQASFILKNGSIVMVDGESNLQMDLLLNPDYNLFVIVWHRNHLPVLSALPLTGFNDNYFYDFTTGPDKSFGGLLAVKEIATDLWGMIAGDGNADGFIDNIDKNNFWKLNAGGKGYLLEDCNLDSEIDNKDKNDLWLENIGYAGMVPD
jgi:hypothetical protein